MASTHDSASYMKVAQLHAAIKDYLDNEYLERIFKKEGSINYELANRNNTEDISTDCNLLHFAFRLENFEKFVLLLENGADFTAQDAEGSTVVHKIVGSDYNFETKFVDVVLSAHVNFGNHQNPRCKYGITHFHAACMRNNVEVVEFFLENGVAVDDAVRADSPIYAGFTPLHFAVEFPCVEVVETLLKHGANASLKNAAGLSPLHVMIDRKIKGKIWGNDDERLLELLAEYHIKASKDVDDFGLSNLHIACIVNTSFLESSFFTLPMIEKSILDEITDIDIVNRPLNANSPICPGYTALHFAAFNSSVKLVELLTDKGADIVAKDLDGITPFDLYFPEHRVEDVLFLLSRTAGWKDVILSDERTRLVDLVCAMNSIEKLGAFLANLESIADLIVPLDSPLWPGYTILHLAVIFSEKAKGQKFYYGWTGETKKVEECLARGADITKSDANHWTALHLAFYSQQFRAVEVLLQHHLTVENPSDNNNLSHFHIACAAGVESAVERFLSSGVDIDVPISSTIKWQTLVRCFFSQLYFRRRHLFFTAGSTALHISVACGNAKITKMLLDSGADVYAKDVYGFTAVHRSLTISSGHFDGEIGHLPLGIDGLRDSKANGGLTHLHVACRWNDVSAIEGLLDSGADVNAVVTYDVTAEFEQEDEYFFDPYGNPSKKPLSFLSRYNGFTPLHFFISDHLSFEIEKLLIRRGADVLAGSSALVKKIFVECDEIYAEDILAALMNDNALRNRWKEQSGLTVLHVACYANQPEVVDDLLSRGEDVNSRVHNGIPVWSGYTPLHLAAINVPRFGPQRTSDRNEILKLLLKNGADVTSKNDNGDTPLHLLSELYDPPRLADCECAHLLLRSLKDFNTNATNCQRISFFHFACLMKNVSVVEEFLKNGIDVNKPVDFFADRYQGCSPLHLAAGYRSESLDNVASQLKIVDLLLKHGADVRAKDVYENTPLHSVAGYGSSRQMLFDIFIRRGVDVNAENVCGETALGVLMKSRNASWEEIQCLLKHGSRINSYNSITQEGSIAQLLYKSMDYEWKALDDDVIGNLLVSECVTEVDGEGRTLLHNFVSISYLSIVNCVELIGLFVKRGCGINCQDKKGRTALHLAAWFRNNHGVFGLLKNGADVNVTDNNGKTAFAYSFASPHDRYSAESLNESNHVLNIFAMHVHKMEACGVYLSEVNKRLQIQALETCYLKEDVLKLFDANIRKSKEIRMESTRKSLFDFGFKINAEMVYPIMPLSERVEIDQFFERISQYNLDELDYLLKFKYEKAVERLRLIDLAVIPFITLIKNQLPDLCCRVILSFLSSSDLKNVIALENL